MVDNGNGFKFNLYKASFGYNEIIYNDKILVYNEQWRLEYKQGQQWKPRGTPQNLTLTQPTFTNVVATRYYTDFIGNTWNVQYDFWGGFNPKISVNGSLSNADDYRLVWDVNGIAKSNALEDPVNHMIKFFDATETPIIFDYTDVYQQLGDVTVVDLTFQANNHKLTQTFDLGFLSGAFQVDPTFGTEAAGAGGNSNGANTKLGTIYTLPDNATITEISCSTKTNVGSANHYAIIYDVAAGAPVNLQITGEAVSCDTTMQYRSWTGGDLPQALVAGDYWIGVICGSAWTMRYVNDVGLTLDWNSDTPPPDDPFGAVNQVGSKGACTHADYTVAGGVSIPVMMHHYNRINKKIRG